MLGSNCDLKTQVRNLGYHLPHKSGAPKTTFFGRLRNLTVSLRAYIFGMEQGIDNRPSVFTTTRGLLRRPKMSRTLVHKRLQNRPAFYPANVNSAFHLNVRLRRPRSAYGTQPNFAKRWMVGCANKVPWKSWSRPSRIKFGRDDFYICSIFRRLQDLMANVCWSKRDIDNRTMALESTKALLRFPKVHELWSTNGLKPDRTFYPPSLFCFVSVHRTPSVRHQWGCPQRL